MFIGNESFELVKNIILNSKVEIISLKLREENGILIVNSSKLNILFLSEVASSFIKLIDDNITVNEIIDKLICEYDVNREIITNDIIILIRELQLKRVIKIIFN